MPSALRTLASNFTNEPATIPTELGEIVTDEFRDTGMAVVPAEHMSNIMSPASPDAYVMRRRSRRANRRREPQRRANGVSAADEEGTCEPDMALVRPVPLGQCSSAGGRGTGREEDVLADDIAEANHSDHRGSVAGPRGHLLSHQYILKVFGPRFGGSHTRGEMQVLRGASEAARRHG